MKKALTLVLASSLVLVASLGVILVNAGIGTLTYRVFYTNEAIVGNQNGDGDSTDDLIVLYSNSGGTFTYIGEGVEPEISGLYVMWHSTDVNPKLYIFKIGTSSYFMPIYYRTYGYHHELHGTGIAYNTLESTVGQILNGDGDMNDKAVGYIDLTNFPMSYPATHWTGEKTQRGGYDGTTITYVKYEAEEPGGSMNGDLDTTDSVIYYRQTASINTELAANRIIPPQAICIGDANQGTYPRVGGNAIVWTTDEDKDECDWDSQGGANDYVVAAFRISTTESLFIEITEEDWEGHHYADDGKFVYEMDAWDNDVGSQSVYTANFGDTKTYVFLGEPIKIVGSTIVGYVNEKDTVGEGVGMDLNDDGDYLDKAMWIFDTSTGQTEILMGGDAYWR
ncbi:MAG: hypothetical protein KAR39_04375 [Thermoplasmata archaeon]|nr:hypothetical protein [Thermoplasmata archaeon]